MRTVQDQITALSEQVVRNREAVEQKHAQLTSSASGSQNIVNYQANQANVKLVKEMSELSAQIESATAQIRELEAKRENFKNEIELQKVKEEHCRQALVVAFEAFCAGAKRKSGAQEQVEDEAGQLYTTILNRTKAKLK